VSGGEEAMRVLDLFAGELGWSRIFAARGHECICIDLKTPKNIPLGCQFIKADVLSLFSRRTGFVSLRQDGYNWTEEFDFIVASSPCEEFSVHGMKHFHPNPKYPEMGIMLFNHTRQLCEATGLPYLMENVRAAQRFVGKAVHHCGPYFLWGNAVPPLVPPRTRNKNIALGGGAYVRAGRQGRIKEARYEIPMMRTGSHSPQRQAQTAEVATIPAELASCVADYAERLFQLKQSIEMELRSEAARQPL